MEKGTNLTVESLYQYLAGFGTSISPFSEEMAVRSSSPDLHKTLIQASYDGISEKKLPRYPLGEPRDKIFKTA